MAFGLLTTGFAPKSLDDIKTDLEAAFRSSFGASINVAPESTIGQLIGILAERFAELWDLGQAVYASRNPDSATGEALVSVCALTGTVPVTPTASTVTLTATGTDATLLPAGRTISVEGTGVMFETLADATITLVDDWAAATAYVLGDRVTNSAKVYECTDPGTSAGSGGPTGNGTAITDNGVVWTYLGEGDSAVDVECESQELGAQIAVSRTLTVIESPVSGWSTAVNLLDADLGVAEETDAELRLRREVELSALNDSAPAAIRRKLLAVDGVTACKVFYNDTDATDGDGLPPHSVECLVLGGDDEEVRAAVFEAVAAGIRSYGSDSGTVTDEEGNDWTVQFSRPTEVTIYNRLDVTYDPDVFPADGSDQIKAAVVAYGDAFAIGKDVRSSPFAAQCFTIPGVLDVPISYIRTSSPAIAATTITTTSRELAVFDTSRITVNLTSGTP